MLIILNLNVCVNLIMYALFGITTIINKKLNKNNLKNFK